MDKEAIAVPLLRQMISELSAEARQALTGGNISMDGEGLTALLSGTSGMSNDAAESPDFAGPPAGISNRAGQEGSDQFALSENFSGLFPGVDGLFSDGAGLLSGAHGSGLSAGSDWSGLLAVLRETVSSAPLASGVTVQQNTTNNVQAPVNISVTASGSDTEALGRAVYDSAERYLVRTLERVCE